MVTLSSLIESEEVNITFRASIEDLPDGIRR